MRKTDPDMVERMVEEVRKLGGSYAEIARRIGCPYQLVQFWLTKSGLPSAYYLRRLHELGCDILYMIVGGERHVRP